MNPATVGSIIEAIARHWPLAPGAEITLEANPSSVEASRFAGYRAAGVNRVSLGVQSLIDEKLRFLGRLHNAAEARAALSVAFRHFERASFDLIYARPGQSLSEWRAELTEALALARGHLSLYQLTIEPGTPFFELERRGRLRIPASDDAASLYELTQELCGASGLPAYEISNHAAPGEESRHNLLYWRYGDYAGIGPGAHGRLTFDGRKTAFAAERDPVRWAEAVRERGCGASAEDILSPLAEAEEMLLMGLRLREGLDLRRLEAQTGFTVPPAVCTPLLAEGLLCTGEAPERLAATEAGFLVLNTLVENLAASLMPVKAEARA
jgi:oxygen-independent coproporphyrinogen-3 oxidase